MKEQMMAMQQQGGLVNSPSIDGFSVKRGR